MSDKNLLGSTKQLWKIRMALYSPLLLPIVIVFYESFLKESGYSISIILYSTFLVITLSFVFAIFSVRCPYCKYKIFRVAISNIEKSKMQKWLKTLEVCPRCGKH
jgi:hypothetical protein